MTEQTVRFSLPLLAPGQAQKEFFHNEALAAIDAALHPVVEDAGTVVPPTDPAAGQAWIAGAAAGGDWAGADGKICIATAGGWRFIAPVDGMTAWNRAAGCWSIWDGSDWKNGEFPVSRILVNGVQVLGDRQAAISDPAGGATVDAQSRAAIAAMLEALRQHGLIAG